MFRRTALATAISLLVANPVLAEQAREQDLGEITVTATRAETALEDVPAAISVVTRDDIQLGRQQLGLDESLARIPGLFMLDRYNFTQDLRISIRGFGSRSSFGIRGIKVFVDDLPETLPDGQSGVDDIDIGSLGRVEVLRGPTGSIYGSAAGGVINLYTEKAPETPFVEGRFTYGEYNFYKSQVKGGGQVGDLGYLISASHLTYEGYRNHSNVEHMGLNSKFRYRIDESSDFTTVINLVHSPNALDPGGLTASEVSSDRTQARSYSVQHDGGESLDKQRIGFIYNKRFNEHHAIKLRNYYTWQQFSNKLPIPGAKQGGPKKGVPNSNKAGGIVEFHRFFVGGGAQWTWTDQISGHDNRFIAGFDIDSQNDYRTRFYNNDGSKGLLSLDQYEGVTNYGAYVRDEFWLLDTLQLSAGARYDKVSYTVDDSFTNDVAVSSSDTQPDDSLDKDFEDVSVSGGILWHAAGWATLYGNIATSFETPTTTQLANPTGGGGFNTTLRPTTSIQYEIGARGEINPMVAYDLALFHTDVSDELVGYITGGRAFFSNADTTRNGLEAQVILRPWRGFRATFSYTWSDFEFDSLRSTDSRICHIGNCDGKRLPGVPMNQFYAEAVYYHPSGWYFGADFQAVGDFHADNENETTVESYQVANLRFGKTVTSGQWEINPFVGVNNLFSEEYNNNIRINASDFGGDLGNPPDGTPPFNYLNNRYFEPAPERNIFVGLSIRYLP